MKIDQDTLGGGTSPGRVRRLPAPITRRVPATPGSTAFTDTSHQAGARWHGHIRPRQEHASRHVRPRQKPPARQGQSRKHLGTDSQGESSTDASGKARTRQAKAEAHQHRQPVRPRREGAGLSDGARGPRGWGSPPPPISRSVARGPWHGRATPGRQQRGFSVAYVASPGGTGC